MKVPAVTASMRSGAAAAASLGFLVLSVALPAANQSRKPAQPDGKALFAKTCAPCHGDRGQGGPGYKSALAGSLSVDGLSAFIHRSMPPSGARCPEPEAKQIASYMYSAFYSPTAQA